MNQYVNKKFTNQYKAGLPVSVEGPELGARHPTLAFV